MILQGKGNVENATKAQFKPIVSGEGKNVISMQVPRIQCCRQTPPPASSMELYQQARSQNSMSPPEEMFSS